MKARRPRRVVRRRQRKARSGEVDVQTRRGGVGRVGICVGLGVLGVLGGLGALGFLSVLCEIGDFGFVDGEFERRPTERGRVVELDFDGGVCVAGRDGELADDANFRRLVVSADAETVVDAVADRNGAKRRRARTVGVRNERRFVSEKGRVDGERRVEKGRGGSVRADEFAEVAGDFGRLGELRKLGGRGSVGGLRAVGERRRGRNLETNGGSGGKVGVPTYLRTGAGKDFRNKFARTAERRGGVDRRFELDGANRDPIAERKVGNIEPEPNRERGRRVRNATGKSAGTEKVADARREEERRFAARLAVAVEPKNGATLPSRVVVPGQRGFRTFRRDANDELAAGRALRQRATNARRVPSGIRVLRIVRIRRFAGNDERSGAVEFGVDLDRKRVAVISDFRPSVRSVETVDERDRAGARRLRDAVREVDVKGRVNAAREDRRRRKRR